MNRSSSPRATRTCFCCILVLLGTACGGSSSDGSNGPPALTNTIVFVSDRTYKPEIYLMSGNGKNVRLIPTIDGSKGTPVISPDGKRIVFTGGLVNSGVPAPLWIVNTDGTGLQQLTSAGGYDYEPTWSPDGSTIAFTSTRTYNAQIFVMNADGSGQTNISNNAFEDFSPSWSPTGNTILFASDRDTVPVRHIYSMTSTGESVTSLVPGSYPKWSPTGSRFLLERVGQIFISSDAIGSTVTQVTNDGADHFYPDWSPGESKLVFSSLADSGRSEQLWTVRSYDGGDAIALTRADGSFSSSPSWTRH
jgi:Tol biopolymer transport system component